MHLFHKPIGASCLVLFTFVFLTCSSAFPISTEKASSRKTREHESSSSPTVKKNEPGKIEQEGEGPTRIQEEEKPNQKIEKKKKFPILLVVLGVAVVATLVLVLGKKKNETTLPTTQTSTYIDGVLTIKGVRYELLAIPAGEFQMGSDHPDDLAQPVHTVRISKGFWLGKTEVTQGLCKAVMNGNPSYFPKGDDYPVENMSWNDCQVFIQKLNQMIGSNQFRLPTEAEWEYSCRAGTTGYRYGVLDSIAWYKSNSGVSTHPVAQLQANAWGLYDMLGNVGEWVQDWYGKYTSDPQVDPVGPLSGNEWKSRVMRGGGCLCEAKWVSSAYRYAMGDYGRAPEFGLRLAANSSGN